MRTAGSIHEIILINPINSQRIITALETIEHDNSDYLLIDSGAHDFASISAMKFLRDRLTGIAILLRRYQKIALIHPEKLSQF